MGSKQHYVPRLYLKAFQSEPKRIHLYNIKRSTVIKNVSLRDQWYQRNFYGRDGDIESILKRLEDEWDRVLVSIRSSGEFPSRGTGEYAAILSFVGVQSLRTLKAASDVSDLVARIREQIKSSGRRFGDDYTEEDLNRQLGELDNPIDIVLPMAPRMIEHIQDLDALLIVSPRSQFVTSDNPAFKYNQYCEGSPRPGATGLICK